MRNENGFMTAWAPEPTVMEARAVVLDEPCGTAPTDPYGRPSCAQRFASTCGTPGSSARPARVNAPAEKTYAPPFVS